MTFDVESVRRRLPGRRVEYFEMLDTTMREAAELAAAGAPAGTVVIAGEQTAGQGRHGHAWHSEAGSGLYLSLVLPAASPPAVTLALGLAAAEAIARVTDLECDLRWPNDLLLNERKAAGILVQVESGVLIAGIGINVNHTAFPEELTGIATSLRQEAGRAFSREELAAELCDAVDRYLRMLHAAGKEKIFDLFTQRSSYARGRAVRVERPEGLLRGVTAGLDGDGFLRVRTADGREHLIVAGGVRAAGA